MPRPEAKPKTPFGVRLRALRKNYGFQERGRTSYTAKDFAAELGVPAETYRTYERGIHNPPFDTLVRLQQLTRVSIDWLLFGENPSNLQPQRRGHPEEPLRYVRRA